MSSDDNNRKLAGFRTDPVLINEAKKYAIDAKVKFQDIGTAAFVEYLQKRGRLDRKFIERLKKQGYVTDDLLRL